MNKGKYTFILIISVLVFIASIVANYILLTSVDKSEALALEGQRKVITEEKIKRQKESLASAIANSEEGRNKLDSYLVEKTDVVSLIEKVEQTATDLGMNIDIVNFSEDKSTAIDPTGHVSVIGVTVSSQGSWDKIDRLINAIDNLPYKVTIKSIDLTKTSDADPKVGSAQYNHWRMGMQFNVLSRSK